MRITMEGPFTREELRRFVRLFKEIDQAHLHLVQTFLAEGTDFTPAEFVEFLRQEGLPYFTEYPMGRPAEGRFETGGGYFLIPFRKTNPIQNRVRNSPVILDLFSRTAPHS